MRVQSEKLVRIAAVGVVFGAFLAFGVARGQQSPGLGSPTMGNAGQQSTNPNPGARGLPTTLQKMDAGEPPDPLAGRMEEQQAKSRNVDRQKRLQSDTEKLLSLATELKQQVDKTDKNILSVDVIKKADEIEKLAKSVKDRMKG